MKLFNGIISGVPLLADLSVHFGSLLLNSISPNWQKLLVFAGAAAITASTALYINKFYVFANIFIKHKLNQAKSSAELLKSKYGDCWIAITGFTEGIGWAFVNELLRLNMKVILIGRNK